MSESETCWANRFGVCSAEMSSEHLVTRALFGGRVRIESENAPWFSTPTVEMPIRKLSANILCRNHNNLLGRTADWAALKLVRCLNQSNTPTALPSSGKPRLPCPRRVSGVNFARWLCKTHCNLMRVNSLNADPDFARYAFLQPTEKRLHFFLVGTVGETVTFAGLRDATVRYTQLVSDIIPNADAFVISLAGFTTLVTPFEDHLHGQEMLDRVAVAQWETPLGLYRIKFDWTGEPATLREHGHVSAFQDGCP